MRKPILCLDFDGVIHSYASGWKGAAIIPDPPVPGAINNLIAYTEAFTVCIHSSRFNAQNARSPGQRPMDAGKDWLIENGLEPTRIVTDGDEACLEPSDGLIYLCATKPPALLTIDDRAITFTGIWPTVDDLMAFVPWNKQNI